MANDVDIWRAGIYHSSYNTITLAYAAAIANDEIRIGQTDSPYYEVVDVNASNDLTFMPKTGETPICQVRSLVLQPRPMYYGLLTVL